MNTTEPSTTRPSTHPAVTGATARNALTLVGLAGLALFSVLYLASPAGYFKLIALFFYFDQPRDPPFQDLTAVMTSIECWQKGYAAYWGTGTCGGFIYSPLWLRMGFMAKGALPGGVAGLLLGTLFFLSLRLLPTPRSRPGLALMLLATVSSTCVFAVERGNLDVLLFVMCLAGAALLSGAWPRRAWAYALFTAAGLLKFYPIVVMYALVRERWAGLLAVLAVFAATVGAFLLLYGDELVTALRGVGALNTHWGPFSDRFGAQQLAAGLWLLATSDVPPPTAFALLPGVSTAMLAPPIWAVPALTLAALAVAIWLLRKTDFKARWQALSKPEADCLLVGAVVMAGCFFAGYNIMYRGIFLLLALPGLIALASARSGVRVSFFLRLLPLAVVYNMWAPTTQHGIQYLAKVTGALTGGRALITADWLLHEIAWWWTMAVFIAVMLHYAALSPALQTVMTALRGKRPAPSNGS